MVRNNYLCPICKQGQVLLELGAITCNSQACKNSFLQVFDKPILVDFDKSILNKKKLLDQEGKSLVVRTESQFLITVKRFLFGDGLNTRKNMQFIADKIRGIENFKILVVGGGTIGAGMSSFYKEFGPKIDAFDIYISENINFIADAHDIPIQDNSYDLIIVQAVLEHVINPSKVVTECFRIMKDYGFIYAETPFMQQVHEGPYDFTRFTDSGHRLLFRNFLTIKSGTVAGVGTSLMWSLSYFFGGLFRNKSVGKLTRGIFFWLRLLDFFVPENYNIDGASGVFFLGQKVKGKSFSDDQISIYYNGAQK